MTIYKKFRVTNGISQREMSEKLEISFNAYINYENGTRKMPVITLLKFLKLRNLKEDERVIEVLEDSLGLGDYDETKNDKENV